MEPREKRRDRTYRYSKKAQKVHLRYNHPDGKLDCECERSDWYFRKSKSMGCRCRRRPHKGNPKVAGSICHGAGYHPTVLARIARHRMLRNLSRFIADQDPVDFEDPFDDPSDW